MEFLVRLRGSGAVEIAAYGTSDAEHQVEKEIRRLWPEARVEIMEIRRPDAEGRIVEEFRVSYRVRGSVRLHAPSADAAKREALRTARGWFGGTRYHRIEWAEAEAADA